jgi:hypothetical protein
MRILVGFKYRLVITIWLYKCENVYIIMVALIDMVVKQGFDHVIRPSIIIKIK